ncbi:glycoside hydrolase family 15 protein [Paenibacillus sp. A3]|uniref:glycoside hydrolase family 15 protein n=1 Tax=Paenibacillus sp. A3 TaxID=1337054 RepID=UPI0006D540B8|nr:glycoside hydrolase family 15 protein [Paenibacillus sp. A3]
MRSKMNEEELVQASIRLIRLNQHPEGGYVACPLFAHYAYGWLRDGSFVAYAMDTAGEHDSAALFYDWANRIIASKQGQIRYLTDKQSRGEHVALHEFLHTRYHLDGRDDTSSEWGHFQLDGYGAWLWGLTEHLRAVGSDRIPDTYRISVDAAVDYLRAFWRYPNFDCWEEYGEHVHPSTLACIYGGLEGVARLDDNAELHHVCSEIKEFLLQHGVHSENGHFVKNITPVPQGDSTAYVTGYAGVDASLLWLAEPFLVFDPQNPVMHKTIEAIKTELRSETGGVRRYASDTYYGGGEWLLLAAWYGLVQLGRGHREEAVRSLEWIAAQADELGRFPEQVRRPHGGEEAYDDWVGRWGPPATPLLWSHAMFMVLYYKLRASA